MEGLHPLTEFQFQNCHDGNKNENSTRNDFSVNDTNSLRILKTWRGHVVHRPKQLKDYVYEKNKQTNKQQKTKRKRKT